MMLLDDFVSLRLQKKNKGGGEPHQLIRKCINISSDHSSS